MKPGPGYLQLAADYVEVIVNAKQDGKQIVFHGTQIPTEPFFAMDTAPRFNEVFSMMGGPVRELYDLSASGNASKTRCTYLRK
jgi:hypothetical protein